ncbi:MAG: flagellar motor switch phosphatase FliY [Caldicoprobacterales bacterium]|jgi:flagellar motor switch protein FliN/FliY|nr:flagellar motor switch phosphatase FliY [Clostridiales bacterium]
MGELLSQEEIDALLKGNADEDIYGGSPNVVLTEEEKDALGEIGNIAMGTAATTLYTLLNHKVLITTPNVTITTLNDIAEQYPIPFVAVKIQYTKGLEGNNLLIITEDDVKTITDLLMGGDGTNIVGELNELQLSAISEVMNQMIGSSATSLASMLGKDISISPPDVFNIDLANKIPDTFFKSDEPIVKVNFKMEIPGILDSYLMQLIPPEFAKEMVESLIKGQTDSYGQDATVAPSASTESVYSASTATGYGAQSREESTTVQDKISRSMPPVGVQPVIFQPFEDKSIHKESSNIDLILDVPLQISVELGKTRKKIQEILELSPGSIVELDKMAGEPVDILVNGKIIAKGEVVVIDDTFGVRITDILTPSSRISHLR